MIRGTTPILRFKLPFAVSDLSDAYITFEQRHHVKFEKTLEDAAVDEQVIALTLKQEDTLKLAPDKPLLIQIRAKTPEDIALASQIITVNVQDILKEGVI